MGIKYTNQGVPYLENPLEDNIMAFINEAHDQFLVGGKTVKWFRNAMGKATGYAECQFSYGSLTVDATMLIMSHIRKLNDF